MGRAHFTIYSGAQALMLPALVPVLAVHPRLRGGIWQRLGGAPQTKAATDSPIWLHGASAGDVGALLPLVERLELAGRPCVLSSWTRAGQQLAQTRTGRPVFRAPLDLAGPVDAALERVRPRLLVLECLELWPRLVHTCHARGIPVAIVNGRLSTRSLRRYQRVRGLFEDCFKRLTFVSALDEGQAERFVVAGVPSARVVVRASSKHAAQAVGVEPAPARCKLVLGSVHAAEERELFPLLARLRQRVPQLELVVAPRYPHRAARVQRALSRHGISATLASAKTPSSVIVVDEMGALRDHYRGARVVFVGGSLVARGGHNVVEAAAHGAVVMVGPHVDNCRGEVDALCVAGAAVPVVDGQSFAQAVETLLCRAGATHERGLAGWRVTRELAAGADLLAEDLLALARQTRGQAPACGC